jgi:hypothetical protein
MTVTPHVIAIKEHGLRHPLGLFWCILMCNLISFTLARLTEEGFVSVGNGWDKGLPLLFIIVGHFAYGYWTDVPPLGLTLASGSTFVALLLEGLALPRDTWITASMLLVIVAQVALCKTRHCPLPWRVSGLIVFSYMQIVYMYNFIDRQQLRPFWSAGYAI